MMSSTITILQQHDDCDPLSEQRIYGFRLSEAKLDNNLSNLKFYCLEACLIL